MSDFLTSLVARSMAYTGQMQPRPPSRFEGEHDGEGPAPDAEHVYDAVATPNSRLSTGVPGHAGGRAGADGTDWRADDRDTMPTAADGGSRAADAVEWTGVGDRWESPARHPVLQLSGRRPEARLATMHERPDTPLLADRSGERDDAPSSDAGSTGSLADEGFFEGLTERAPRAAASATRDGTADKVRQPAAVARNDAGQGPTLGQESDTRPSPRLLAGPRVADAGSPKGALPRRGAHGEEALAGERVSSALLQPPAGSAEATPWASHGGEGTPRRQGYAAAGRQGHAGRPRRAEQQLPLVAPDLPTLIPEPAVAPTAPTPTVHVTIGRVEVRAGAPARSPQQGPSRSPRVSTLEEYLRGREGGR